MASFKEYIISDRPCDKCGYNLNGLPKDGNCPECGQPIRRTPAAAGPRSGTMSAEAPTRYVRLLLTGFAILSVSIVGMVIANMVMLYSAIVTPICSWTLSQRLISGLLIGSVHLLWPLGIWLVTTPRVQTKGIVRNDILDNPRARTIVRFGSYGWGIQWLFLYFTLASVCSPTWTSAIGTETLMTGYAVFSLIGWLGLIPASVYIGDLAFWSAHETIGARLRSTAWAMSVFGLLTVLTALIMPLISFMLLVATAGATLVFLISILQVTNVLHWVIKHQEYAAGSRDRIAERVQRESTHRGCVSTGLRCRKCKYDLNGLPHGGCCPECGESYADITPIPVRDPAKSVRNEPDLELVESTHQEIIPSDQLDTLGNRRPPKPDEDDGPIPLA